MLHFADVTDSEEPTVCRCSKGFRSVSGHGHFHCHHCQSSFRFRANLFAHEEQVHGKTKTDSDSVKTRSSQSLSLRRRGSKKCAELSSKDKNADEQQVIRTPDNADETSRAESDSVEEGLLQHQLSVRCESRNDKCAGETTITTTGQTAETSPGKSVSVETLPPPRGARRKKMQQSDNGDRSDSIKCDEFVDKDKNAGDHHGIRTTGHADETSPDESVSVEALPPHGDASKTKVKQSDSSVGNSNSKNCDELSHRGKNADDHNVIRTSGHAKEISPSESVSVETVCPHKGASRKKMKRSRGGDEKNDGKKCDEVSSEDKNAGERRVVRTTGCWVPEKTFPPYKGPSRKNIKQSDMGDVNGDGKKYARQVTIHANGIELISQVPCYSGNAVFPRTIGRGQKAQCPVCNKLFVRIKTLRNHAICVHNAINSGETLYSCIPCSFKTSFHYSFGKHRTSDWHRSNLRHDIGNSNGVNSTPQTYTSLAALFSQQRAAQSLYSNTAMVRTVAKQTPRVVWLGHSNHVCSSQCLSGLTTEQTSEDEATTRTLRPRKSLPAPAATVTTAATSIDTMKESRKLRSSDAHVHEKVTAGKLATQSRAVSKTANQTKETAVEPRKVRSISKTVKMPVTRSATNKDSSPQKAITIIDSDSDSKETADVKTTQRVTRLSDSDKKRTSSRNTTPSTPSADKQKDNLSKMSADVGGSSVQAHTSKSVCPTGSQRPEAMKSRCLGSGGSPSVVSISQQDSCKSTTSLAVKTPAAVAAILQVPASRSSNIQVNKPVPVVGVAKAVQSVPVTPQTTVAMNRSVYSLHRFSADTLWSELCRRGGMRSCECGISFMDTTLYLLHRSCHSDLAPLKCAFCDHKSATCYDFHAHLLDHKK